MRVAKLIITACLLAAIPVAAQASERSTWGVVVENDVFAGADRDYTSGLKAYAVLPSGRGAALARTILRAGQSDQSRLGFAFGQSLFTPDDYQLVTPPADQHPSAGWLYGEASLTVARESGIVDIATLQAGIVGPAALGEESQRFIHRTFNFLTPRGWPHQLRNEPGLAVSFDRRWRGVFTSKGDMEFNVAPFAGASLGNVLTEARTGLVFRMGTDLAHDFGAARVNPGTPSSGFDERTGNFAWTLYGIAAGHAKARDIFLDGNTFVSSASVDKRNFVGDFQAGVTLKFGRINISYAHNWKTRQYATEIGPHSFGALTLSARF